MLGVVQYDVLFHLTDGHDMASVHTFTSRLEAERYARDVAEYRVVNSYDIRVLNFDINRKEYFYEQAV